LPVYFYVWAYDQGSSVGAGGARVKVHP